MNPGEFPDFEHALSEMQCVLLAHRAANNRDSIKLAWVDFDIMDYLQLKGSRTPSDLCTIFNLSRSSMSKHLKRLREYRLIEYKQNSQDGRSYFVSITADGRLLIDAVRQSRYDLAAKAREVLTEDEQRQFAVLANKITTALDDPTLHVI